MSQDEVKTVVRNSAVGAGEGALAGLILGNPVLGALIGTGVGAAGIASKLKLPLFKGGDVTPIEQLELKGGGYGYRENEDQFSRVVSNAAVGAGQGALVGLAFGNAGAGAKYGAVLGGLGVGRSLGLPFFRGGSRRKSRKYGRGNVFNEMANTKKSRKRKTMRKRMTRPTAPFRLGRSRASSSSRSTSSSSSRSRSRSRSRSPKRRVSRSLSPSHFNPTFYARSPTSAEKEVMRLNLKKELEQAEYYRKNPHKISPGQYIPGL